MAARAIGVIPQIAIGTIGLGEHLGTRVHGRNGGHHEHIHRCQEWRDVLFQCLDSSQTVEEINCRVARALTDDRAHHLVYSAVRIRISAPL